MSDPRRTTWQIVRTCLFPEVRLHRDGYLVESPDGLDEANCWHIEIEWLSLYASISGGRYRP